MDVGEREERRVCTRTLFLTGVTLKAQGVSVDIDANLLDVSISGLYVRCAQALPVGTPCTIRIRVNGNHSNLVLEELHGAVVRQDRQGLAIQFASPMEWFVLFKIYNHYGR